MAHGRAAQAPQLVWLERLERRHRSIHVCSGEPEFVATYSGGQGRLPLGGAKLTTTLAVGLGECSAQAPSVGSGEPEALQRAPGPRCYCRRSWRRCGGCRAPRTSSCWCSPWTRPRAPRAGGSTRSAWRAAGAPRARPGRAAAVCPEDALLDCSQWTHVMRRMCRAHGAPPVQPE